MLHGDDRLDILRLHAIHPCLADSDLERFLERVGLRIVELRDAVNGSCSDWHLTQGKNYCDTQMDMTAATGLRSHCKEHWGRR